jgi:N-acetylmuramoyl-L-alanine amidase
MKPIDVIISRAKTVLLVTALVLLSPAGEAGAGGGKVTNIRHWSDAGYSRVVVDMSKAAEFNHHLLKKDPSINKPRRLYVDIDAMTIAPGVKKAVAIEDGLLKGVRAGQYKPGTVRVVLDIESIDTYKVFALTKPPRIVIDVYGSPVKGRELTAKKAGPQAGVPAKPAKKDPSGTKPIPPRTAPPASAPREDVIKTIAIDAGHGGKDPGAIGRRGLREKDITLKIAKMLKKELRANTDKNIKLTRSTDIYIPLNKRNVKGADLFISVHVNASLNRKTRGVETYYLDWAHDKKARNIAARENKEATEKESDVLRFILDDLARTGNRLSSEQLAIKVQGSLAGGLKKKYSDVVSNGVRGAPFYVLSHSKVPGILVEVSYISNARDEKRLRDERYLKEIVTGITNGILAYINGERMAESR